MLDEDDKAPSIPNKKIKLAKPAQPSKPSRLTHAQVLMLLEMKKRRTLDMKVYANNGMDKVVPRTLRYGVSSRWDLQMTKMLIILD